MLRLREQYLPIRCPFFKLTLPSFPIYRGVSRVANNVFGSASNNVRTGPLNWYGAAFCSWRGSLRWKINRSELPPSKIISLNYSVGRVGNGFGGASQTVGNKTQSLDTYDGVFITAHTSRLESGGTMVDVTHNNVLEFTMPYHYQTRFQIMSIDQEKERPLVVEDGSASFGFYNVYESYESFFYPQYYSLLVAGGDDISYHFFKYVPRVRFVPLYFPP